MPADQTAGSGFTLAPELISTPAEQPALLALARATALACQADCCALVSETMLGVSVMTVSAPLPEKTQALIQDLCALVQATEQDGQAETDLVLREHLTDSDELRETPFVAAAVVRSERGKTIGLLVVFDASHCADTTTLDEKLSTMALAAQGLLERQWYYDAYVHSPALLYSTDDHGLIEEVSQLWLTHFGYTRREVIGRAPTDFMTTAAREDLEGFANHIHLTAGVKDFPSQFVTAGGRAVDVLMSIALERQTLGQASNSAKRSKCLIVDITLQIQIQRALEARARLDEMTGIPNRAWIRERYQVEAARAARHKRPLSLVLFDADRFKQLNDQHGHAAGDHALVILANTARHQLRGADEVGRIGGEEFALLLPETDLTGALHVAERLRQGVAELPVKEVGLPCPLTISLGVVEVSLTTTTEQAFARADAAMYEAKRTGRNRVVAWHSDLPCHPSATVSSIAATPEQAMGPIV